MSTRRKPKAYRDGGRVLADTAIPDDDATERPENSAPTAPPVIGSDGSDALVRAASAARRAEELQREALTRQSLEHAAPQPSGSVEDVLSAMKVPDTAKEWLRERPEYLTDATMNQRIGAAHNFFVNVKGIEPFSQPYFDALDELHSEVVHHRELTSARARPLPENFEAAQLVADLDRDINEYQAEAAAVERAAVAPATAIRKATIPMGAPVSRETPMPSGQRESSTRITLSAEERDIAHKSRRDLPPLDAELLYARNKRLMMERKANGEIQGDGQ